MRSLRAMPSQATMSPSRAVKQACPLAASVVMTSVLARLHRWASAVRTNGSECVGMAAWKTAMLNPVTAIVVRTESFMGIRPQITQIDTDSEKRRKSADASEQPRGHGEINY